MKFTIAVFASLIAALHAQTVVKEAVVKNPSTNALTESIVIPSGLSLTINSGATITNNGTATGFGSGGTWGSITGTLSNQTDLNFELSLLAPKANPTFTNSMTIDKGGSVSSIKMQRSNGFYTTLFFGGSTGGDTFLFAPESGNLMTESSALNASNISSGSLALARLAQGGATSGQALAWNGSAWAPATIASGITIGTTTANGTAGRVLYTDGTNVQQYAVTGTGDVVRATSPTLVTPLLGTPTSGTLTNCTGLPAAGVVGTAVVGATGSTDNAILRANGTGGGTAQGSVATITDAGAPTFYDSITLRKTGTSTDGGLVVDTDPLNPGVDSTYIMGPQNGSRVYFGKGANLPGAINYNNAGNENFGNIISTAAHYQIISYGGSGITSTSFNGPITFVPTASTGVKVSGSFVEMDEMTAPAAPASDKARIFIEDNGSGKTRLMVRFPSGASQQIAIEP